MIYDVYHVPRTKLVFIWGAYRVSSSKNRTFYPCSMTYWMVHRGRTISVRIGMIIPCPFVTGPVLNVMRMGKPLVFRCHCPPTYKISCSGEAHVCVFFFALTFRMDIEQCRCQVVGRRERHGGLHMTGRGPVHTQ